MGTAGQPWERAWVRAALAGDAAAWRALYDSATDTVGRYARWRTGCPELAEEVAQEAWLTAARRLASFDPRRGSFAQWVCGLAANLARNAVRKRRRYRARVGSMVGVPEPVMEPEDAYDPQRVAAALAELPGRSEEVLRAKYFEQRSVAEIAAARGETEKAVESLLARARQAFREAYERSAGDDR